MTYILIRALVLTAIVFTVQVLTGAVLSFDLIPGVYRSAIPVGWLLLLLLGWYLAARRKSVTTAQPLPPLIKRVATVILIVAIAITVVWSVRLSLLDSYHTVSGSMMPTIRREDYLLAFQWYPTPERGDLVVFIYPTDPYVAIVFRLIGLPQDRIRMIDGHLHINGQPVKRMQVEDYVYAPVSRRSNGARHCRMA